MRWRGRGRVDAGWGQGGHGTWDVGREVCSGASAASGVYVCVCGMATGWREMDLQTPVNWRYSGRPRPCTHVLGCSSPPFGRVGYFFLSELAQVPLRLWMGRGWCGWCKKARRRLGGGGLDDDVGMNRGLGQVRVAPHWPRKATLPFVPAADERGRGTYPDLANLA